MSQRRVLITGATSGIGLEAAAQFADAGYGNVVVSGRTAERAAAAADELTSRTGASVFASLALDLGDPTSVEAAAAELSGDQLDVVVFNAGMLSPADRQFTSDGIELTFASSLIGHHRFLMHLLANDVVRADGRIVIAGSEAARGDVPMMTLGDLDSIASQHHGGDLTAAAIDLIRGVEPKKFKPNDTYATTKLFVAWWAAALARRLPETMTVTAVSPGSTPDTQAGRNANFLTRRVMVPMLKLMPKRLNMAAPISESAGRYLQATNLPAAEAAGAFYASVPKKMSGPLERMSYPHIDHHDHQEAAWHATVAVAGIDLPTENGTPL